MDQDRVGYGSACPGSRSVSVPSKCFLELFSENFYMLSKILIDLLLFYIFQLQEKIGKGEFGDVRLGKREHTFPLCSVSFLRKSPMFRIRIRSGFIWVCGSRSRKARMTQQIKTKKLYQFAEQGIFPEERAAFLGALKSLMEA